MPRTRPGPVPRPRLVLPLLTVALLVGGLLPADPAAAAVPSPRPAFGAVTADLPALGALERAVGQPVASYTFYRAWQSTPDFPAALAAQVRRRGALPVLTWEPWDTTAGVDQPRYALRQIAGGAFDAYVTRWARQVRAFGQPVAIRFGHEMNGTWYPWAAGVNGNSAADYVAAYRHVHDLFDAAGATRVTWVWNPNVTGGGAASLAPLYPGDAYVDQVGLDGYNAGTALPWGGWVSPQQVFGSSLRAVARGQPTAGRAR